MEFADDSMWSTNPVGKKREIYTRQNSNIFYMKKFVSSYRYKFTIVFQCVGVNVSIREDNQVFKILTTLS